MLSILLLIKTVRVEGVRRASHTGQDREGKQGGNDGLHDHTPSFFGWPSIVYSHYLDLVLLALAERRRHPGVINSDVI